MVTHFIPEESFSDREFYDLVCKVDNRFFNSDCTALDGFYEDLIGIDRSYAIQLSDGERLVFSIIKDPAQRPLFRASTEGMHETLELIFGIKLTELG